MKGLIIANLCAVAAYFGLVEVGILPDRNAPAPQVQAAAEEPAEQNTSAQQSKQKPERQSDGPSRVERASGGTVTDQVLEYGTGYTAHKVKNHSRNKLDKIQADQAKRVGE